MNKLSVVLLAVLAVSVGSAQADWIKHEGHGTTAKGAISSITSIHFNQVKHSDLDGFVTACKTRCDENSDTCGGFILNYANTDKTRPAVCVFSKKDSTLAKSPTKDFYQVVSHDEVLALLEQLVPNLNTQEDAKWLTEVLTEAGYLTWLEDNTGYRYENTAISPPTDAGSASASTAFSTTSTSGTQTRKKSSKSSSKDAEPWVKGKGNACWDEDYADGAGKGNGWVVCPAKARKSKLTRAQSRKTPGVYIEERDGFGNSVIHVATAVPAFIGYTPQASYQDKSYLNKPQKITSLAEFAAFYMLPNPDPPADPARQYNPQYYLVEDKTQRGSGSNLVINDKHYAVVPDPNTIYYLYNSVRLFYENGGGVAYIVSVGPYGPPSGRAGIPGQQIVNPNVSLSELKAGLELLKKETEPTMYIIPEATLLNVEDNATLMQSMLLQAQEMQTAVCIFDIIGGRDPDPVHYTDDIETFRKNTGSTGLKYGVSYYPFVETMIMNAAELDYTNLFGGDVALLEPLLNPPDNPNPKTGSILEAIKSIPGKGVTGAPTPLATRQYHFALTKASQTYETIMKYVLSEANVLPPSGAMAGIYTVNDNTYGVWRAPANVGMAGVVGLPIRLSDSQQVGLNVDADSGKSVNAIRFFNGLGIRVWGARTLDGNSQDWRYVPVTRTLIFLEQTVKNAAKAYVFQPNDGNTWAGVQSMISSFLTSIWKEGGLQGAQASDAFQVQVGLGSTMTGEDILNGLMRVSVKVALIRPGEFIVITFEQEMFKG